MSRLIRTFAALTLLGGLGAATGCSSSGTAQSAATASAGGAAPAQGAVAPFWVDPSSPAAWQADDWQRHGRASDARLLELIARQPTAIWPAGDDPGAMMRAATEGADRHGTTALFVAYNIPHRDCGQHSAGGAVDAAAYRQWIDRFAAALGDTHAWVVLEPDAVAHAVDGCTPPPYQAERYQLLSQAIDRLKQQPHTRVYLDAGNPAWITDPRRLVEPLGRAGIGHADGFSLNVSNFQTTGAARAYGHRLSEALAGTGTKHFVVDTSRNGRGPLAGDHSTAWCNPPGRALGAPPTLHTGDPLVDAYLWIKRPGESDGQCRGGPAAGTWWPQYAVGLARAARG
ncbi:glycoside hydrolase family 6 protein [Streptomyces sp. TS71-3]|uniref:glycoside hydrolase family 6 protein n=1 Tax=Streptomyces sp. TS71-3 TaxID=2733862 RepID=UPI001B07904A|nr:glycoside hydrolase family 6 protein [Streptomyces sp. TS71-3]GHJ36102.1 glucanase [Streptomyces sp. TS71-3]